MRADFTKVKCPRCKARPGDFCKKVEDHIDVKRGAPIHNMHRQHYARKVAYYAK